MHSGGRAHRHAARTLGITLGIALLGGVVAGPPAAAEPLIAVVDSPTTGPETGTDPALPTDPGVPTPPVTTPPVTTPPVTPGPTDPAPDPDPAPTPDPTPVPDPAPTPDPTDQEPRGANGGLASDSPGPASAKPWDGRAIPPLTNAAARPLIGDNYPQKYKQYPLYPVRWDEWNFAHRQCTSFVAWRLNTANKIPFSNQYGGLVRWGNAAEWGASARSLGIRVDTTPEVGAIAWSGPYYGGASEFGHVAWVADVLSDGRVVIEEYNYGWAGAYYSRTIRANEFQGYIHIADLTSPFTKTTKPTIAGAPMVGGTLTAAVSGWVPKPTSYRYRWLRDGAVIADATKSSYQPTLADFGKRITVEATGDLQRYRPASTVSAATGAVQMADGNGNGIDDTQEMLPWNSDVNGDGLPDAVGFGSSGVQVALRTKTGFGAAKTWVSGFGTGTGWTPARHPRTLIDVNGDGKSDVVGFAEDGVYVALSTGNGFSTMKRWTAQFGAADGWSVQHHPRTLVDVNGDGRTDILAFASDGVYVALNTGSGFAGMQKWYDGFGTAKAWTVDKTPRFLQDMNGDGRPDVVGISNAGVYVALNTGTKFDAARQWSAQFAGKDGWTMAAHPRTLADVDGDGRPDLVAFASDGVYVATNTGSGLRAMTRWQGGFGTAAGWLVGAHPRVLADVNGDGRADVVGFDNDGVTVALSTGKGFAAPARWSGEFGGKAWRNNSLPRQVTDVDGDGKADVVGFSAEGVRIARSSGKAFGTSKLEHAGMGSAAGGWNVAAHPRAVGILSLTQRPAPQIAGQVRVGEKVTATTGQWQPSPVKIASQWLRDGKAISGATGANYTLTPADRGAQISFRTVGSKPAYASATRVSQSYTVVPGVLQSPVPRITGTPTTGATLTVEPGHWGPAPVALNYQWYRNGAAIAGATRETYRIGETDVARRLTVSVSGSKNGYANAVRGSETVKVSGTPVLPAKPPFADVSASHQFSREIGWMFTSGLSTGVKQQTGKPKFLPKTGVTREAMAAFLFRLAADKSFAAPRNSPFVDVPTTHPFYREITWMHSVGLTTGIQTSRGLAYRPKAAVSREAMAAFLYRLEGPKYSVPASSRFADLKAGDLFYREISWMYDAGLSTGIPQATGKPKYSPSTAVSREATAAFLYRMETQG